VAVCDSSSSDGGPVTHARRSESLLLQLRDAHSRRAFSHIFIDESSQALEPEMLIPLSLGETDTSVVLAGDHKQLGVG